MPRKKGPWEQYADTGCHVEPHCLSCRLPMCIFDAYDRGYNGNAFMRGVRDIQLLQRFYCLVNYRRTNEEIYSTLAVQEEQTDRNIKRRISNGRKWGALLQWDGEPIIYTEVEL